VAMRLKSSLDTSTWSTSLKQDNLPFGIQGQMIWRLCDMQKN